MRWSLLAAVLIAVCATQTSAAAGQRTPPAGSGRQTVTASATNKAVELHVNTYEIASSFQGTAARSGRTFVIVDARWHNILTAATIPYLIPDIQTELQLIVNGESGAKLVNGNFKAPDLLSADGQRIEHGKDVAGRYVFDAATPVTSLELAYFDKTYGNIRIPIAGSAPAAGAGTIAGPTSSGGLTLSVMSVEESDTVGSTHAPPGTRFVVVTARGQGDASIGDNYLEIDPASVSRLVENDGHLYPTAKVEGADDVWSGAMRFVPATPQRGKLVFKVPAQHGPLALSVAIPRQPTPMRLALSHDASAPAKLPAPIATVQDGSTGVFYLYGVRQSGPLLVLDVGIENKSGSGMDFQTKEQIELLQGDKTISASDDDLVAAVRALPEDGVIPPHTFGRFDIPFRVPSGGPGLTLYFRGFENERKLPLPTAR